MPKDASETEWITVSEASHRLHVSTSTVRRAVTDEKIAVRFTPGGHRRLNGDDVEQLRHFRPEGAPLSEGAQ